MKVKKIYQKLVRDRIPEIITEAGKDFSVSHSQSGNKIVNMNVATNERWKDRQTGEMKERAEFHRVVIFDEKLADVAEKYLKKGSKVYLEGTLQTRKWQGNDGQDKYTTEVVLPKFGGTLTMLDSKNTEAAGAGEGDRPGRDPSPGSRDDLDSEIPF